MENVQGYNTLHTCFNSPFLSVLHISLSPPLRFCGLFLLCSDGTTFSPDFNGLTVFSTVFWERLKQFLARQARKRDSYTPVTLASACFKMTFFTHFDPLAHNWSKQRTLFKLSALFIWPV